MIKEGVTVEENLSFASEAVENHISVHILATSKGHFIVILYKNTKFSHICTARDISIKFKNHFLCDILKFADSSTDSQMTTITQKKIRGFPPRIITFNL